MSEVRAPLCGDDIVCECGNCDWAGEARRLKHIVDFEDRVAAGESCPAGECPKCGSLAYIKDEPEVIQGDKPNE